MADKEKDSSIEEFLRIARKKFAYLHSLQSDNRKDSLEDLNFTYNINDAQWDDTEKQKRIKKRRPYLVHNKIRKHVSQVANKERDNQMSQKVKPVDDKADPKIAAIIEGYIHMIEYNSTADEIYCKAGEQALSSAFGFWRILTQYVDDSFDQEIIIKHIENQYSVLLDAKGNHGFIIEVMTKDEFEEKYPDANPVDFNNQGEGTEYEIWFESKEEKLFVAEYFYKKPVTKTIAQVISADDLDGNPEIVEVDKGITKADLERNGIKVLKMRQVESHVVKWCKISANDVLEGWEGGEVRDWAGKDIPIIECKGDEVNVAGKIHKRSLIRDGKDPQRMYNYGITALTEKTGLTPKAPYILTAGMLGPHKAMWDDSNEENYPYLLVEDTPAGTPKRQDPPPVDPGVISMVKLGDGDIQDTLGMYEASFGQKGNERTGRAIVARSSRSDMGTYHFPDNLRRAIQETARQLIDIIPKIVDTERMLRIRDYEGKESLVEVNKAVLGTDQKVTIMHDLSLGRYDVEADVKIWSTRREEAARNMRESMQYAPMLAPIIAKYLFKYDDTPGSSDIEKEINKFIAHQEKLAENEQAIKAGTAPDQTQ